jgi:hypothetical protein
LPESTQNRSGELSGTLAHAACPAWCATGHGVQLGEEDWVHLGEPVPLTDGVSAQLCMTIDPSAAIEDGPYVVIGTSEYSLLEAQALGASLMALATTGASSGRTLAV